MENQKIEANNGERQPALSPATCSADFDDYPEEYWDDEETCEMCGGDGVIEYLDHPEVWGEDCPSYQNHLLPCPECRRREIAERQKTNPPNESSSATAGGAGRGAQRKVTNMECTKCKKKIVKGQKYHRTKRGPHHQDCSNVQGTPAVVQQRGVSRLVDKFLSWPLPESVCSDQCACERGYPNRSGTNLLTATEAEAMIKHLLEHALTKDASNEEEGEMYMRGFFDGMEHEKSANDQAEAQTPRK